MKPQVIFIYGLAGILKFHMSCDMIKHVIRHVFRQEIKMIIHAAQFRTS